MRFYHVKDGYIKYLHSYDEKVPFNKSEARPFVGVVLAVNGIKYYAPLSSPKAKHQKMSNSKDFRKIHNGIYGAINFNNMIPVIDSEIMEIDIQNLPNPRYKRLLQNQRRHILQDARAIRKTAEELRILILTKDSDLTAHDIQVKRRCCNLAVLESVYDKYSAC